MKKEKNHFGHKFHLEFSAGRNFALVVIDKNVQISIFLSSLSIYQPCLPSLRLRVQC